MATHARFIGGVLGWALPAVATALAAALAQPVATYAQQSDSTQQHDHGGSPPATANSAPAATESHAGGMGHMQNKEQMRSRMQAGDARLDALLKKVQAAQGAAKTDAIVELLTALVDERKNACSASMSPPLNLRPGE